MRPAQAQAVAPSAAAAAAAAARLLGQAAQSAVPVASAAMGVVPPPQMCSQGSPHVDQVSPFFWLLCIYTHISSFNQQT